MDSLVKSNGLELVRLRPCHIFPVVENLSDENLREFKEFYQKDPLDSLLSALGDPLSHCVLFEGKPVAIVGLSEGEPNGLGRVALLWAVFTKGIKTHLKAFIRGSKDLIAFYHTQFPTLAVRVWDENLFVINWLLLLKFKTAGSICAPRGMQFAFVRCAEVVSPTEKKLSRPVLH